MNWIERFESKVSRSATGCHLWKGGFYNTGYGQFWSEGVSGRRAHRVAWEIANGPIPAGMNVLHRCDVPSCVNPAHLFLGTNADNVSDRERKKRGRAPGWQKGNVGETNGRAKLTVEDVRAIRSVPIRRGSGIALAVKFGVTRTTIRKIRIGALWSHVSQHNPTDNKADDEARNS